MINKILCYIRWHCYQHAGLLPTGNKDSFGIDTYYLFAVTKCKHCGVIKNEGGNIWRVAKE